MTNCRPSYVNADHLCTASSSLSFVAFLFVLHTDLDSMATDSSEREPEAPAAPVGVPLPGGMTRLPNGVVVDKDGKP